MACARSACSSTRPMSVMRVASRAVNSSARAVAPAISRVAFSMSERRPSNSPSVLLRLRTCVFTVSRPLRSISKRWSPASISSRISPSRFSRPLPSRATFSSRVLRVPSCSSTRCTSSCTPRIRFCVFWITLESSVTFLSFLSTSHTRSSRRAAWAAARSTTSRCSSRDPVLRLTCSASALRF